MAINNNRLFATLLGLHNKRESARVSLMYKDRLAKSSALTIIVCNGEIEKVLPDLELKTFFSSEYSVIKLATTKIDAAADKKPGLVAGKLKTILTDYRALLKAKEASERKEIAITEGRALAMHVEKLITPILWGPGTKGILPSISQVYPPNKDPVEYLKQCMELVSMSLNHEIASEIILPLIVAYKQKNTPQEVLLLIEQK
jgi:hypothetical protein